MKFKGNYLTEFPPIKIVHDKRTDEYKLKLIRRVTFELETVEGSAALSKQIQENIASGKSLRTAIMEIIKSKPELYSNFH